MATGTTTINTRRNDKAERGSSIETFSPISLTISRKDLTPIGRKTG
jgi:hypothetical protein